MDGGAWWAAVHGVAKSQTRLSVFTFTFHFHALEKEMATHSSVLAWRIPGTGEPGGLPSTGSPRVVHDWSDLAAAIQHRQLYSMLCGNLDRRGVWRRMNTYKCMTKSCQCSPEAITTLLTGYIQHKIKTFKKILLQKNSSTNILT